VDTGLAGKGVLVTGGAGGIGSACVRAFAAEGARVAIHYRTSRERAEELAREIGTAAVLQADLTEEAQVERLFAEARDELGQIHVCAAVAGMWPRDDEPVWRLSLARWEEVLRANLTVTFLTARGFLREVRRTGHGSLVLVGSTAGRFGEAGHADYASAKAAIQAGLLLSLKNEIVRIAPGGRVNAVAPGWTYSPMTRGELDEDVVERLTRTMALRKVALTAPLASQTPPQRECRQSAAGAYRLIGSGRVSL
jgi:3-oxoacyl-[acyl-carrier protein] reductase